MISSISLIWVFWRRSENALVLSMVIDERQSILDNAALIEHRSHEPVYTSA